MIFPNVRVEIPNIGGYIQQRNDVRYFFIYVGDRLLGADGKTTHPKSKMIGRIETNKNGTDELMPNESYYKIMGINPPKVAVKEGQGTKPKNRGCEPQNRQENSQSSPLFGLIALRIFNELGVTEALEKAFEPQLVKEILAIATFLCDGPHSSFEDLNRFVNEHLCFNVSSSFDRRRAGETIVKLSPEKRAIFFKEWIKKQTDGKTSNVFYDVTSYSTYSGEIFKAAYGYNRDHEDLKQVNQGLFCLKENGLPLFMIDYNGSIVDKQNFNYALDEATSYGLKNDHNSVTIITDGGFCISNFDWSIFKGYELITGVSCNIYKTVKAKFLEWACSLCVTDYTKGFIINDDCYIGTKVPFTLGELKGSLYMYKDLETATGSQNTFYANRDKVLQRLLTLNNVPQDDKEFKAFAKKFSPYFKVTKADNDKGFVYEPDEQQTLEALALCGKVTLFVQGNEEQLSPKEIMEKYRSKESVEDSFDTVKNGLCDKRLHVHGDRQVDGKLFLLFIALILWRTLHYRLKDWQYSCKSTVHAAITELKQIKSVKRKEQWILKDAVSKTQREILSILDPDWEQTEGKTEDNISYSFKPRQRYNKISKKLKQ
jgi:hypothetical protein